MTQDPYSEKGITLVSSMRELVLRRPGMFFHDAPPEDRVLSLISAAPFVFLHEEGPPQDMRMSLEIAGDWVLTVKGCTSTWVRNAACPTLADKLRRVLWWSQLCHAFELEVEDKHEVAVNRDEGFEEGRTRADVTVRMTFDDAELFGSREDWSVDWQTRLRGFMSEPGWNVSRPFTVRVIDERTQQEMDIEVPAEAPR